MKNAPRKSRERAALDAILEEVKEGVCPMPILLHGEEEYRLEESRRRIIEAALPDKAERAHGVETVSAKEVNLEGVLHRMTGSLFAARQVLVVRDAQLLAKAGSEEEEEGGAAPKRRKSRTPAADANPWASVSLGTVVVLIANPGMDKRTRVYKQIEAHGRLFACERMKKEGEILDWAEDYLRRVFRKTMSPAARSLLWRRVGGGPSVSLLSLTGDLSRLALYAGDRPRIEESDVDLLVERSGEEVVFDLARAVTSRARERALALLGEFLGRGESPVLLVSLLGNELRALLEASILLEESDTARRAARAAEFWEFRRLLPKIEAEIAARRPGMPVSVPMGGRNPYPLFLALQAAGELSREELLRGIRLTARADREIKSSGRPERLVFELLILKMTEAA